MTALIEQTPREELYGDIITTAIEGGIGYWSETSQYQYVYDGEIRPCVSALVEGTTRATIHLIEDATDAHPVGAVCEITPDTIARAFGVLRRAHVQSDGTVVNDRSESLYTSQKWRQRMLGIYSAPEDADIDADDADMLVQLGLFTRVIFG
jgi:hypothetical protein